MSVACNHDFATDFSKAVRDSIKEEKHDADIPIFRDIFYDVRVEDGSTQAKKWKLAVFLHDGPQKTFAVG